MVKVMGEEYNTINGVLSRPSFHMSKRKGATFIQITGNCH